jgi:hypothetical protein
MLASLTFWSVVRLLMSTVIICRGICCTRLAREIAGSKEGSGSNVETSREYSFPSLNLEQIFIKFQGIKRIEY